MSRVKERAQRKGEVEEKARKKKAGEPTKEPKQNRGAGMARRPGLGLKMTKELQGVVHRKKKKKNLVKLAQQEN